MSPFFVLSLWIVCPKGSGGGQHLALHLSVCYRGRRSGPWPAFWRRVGLTPSLSHPAGCGFNGCLSDIWECLSALEHTQTSLGASPKIWETVPSNFRLCVTNHLWGFSETLTCWCPHLGTYCHPSIPLLSYFPFWAFSSSLLSPGVSLCSPGLKQHPIF